MPIPNGLSQAILVATSEEELSGIKQQYQQELSEVDDQTKQTVDMFISVKRSELAQAAQNETLAAQNEKLSLISALSYGEGLGKFTHQGSAGSSGHLSATNQEREIEITQVEENLQICKQKERGPFARQLRQAHACFSLESNPRSFTEADLQFIVSKILEDAVSICNIMLGLRGDKEALFIRREASLLTNRPDHSAVYLRDREVPIVTIEDKPGRNSVKEDRVLGQVFDQFLETVLLTWTGTAVGAVTSIESTRIAWIGEHATELLCKGDLLSFDTLENCRNCLMDLRGKSQTETPSPKKKEGYRKAGDSDIQMHESSTRPRQVKKHRVEPKQKIFVSQCFEGKKIIHVFCNLIMAGVLLNTSKTKVFTLPPKDENAEIPACVVLHSRDQQGEGPIIDSLTTQIRGPATARGWRSPWPFGSPYKYFLVALLDVGKTSKAFRAVTDTGHECVVKLYVLEYDDDGNRIQDFDKRGGEAVSREKRMYHEIYPELKEHVWTERLCQRHCLILPFFEEIDKDKRSSYVEKVGSLYKEKFWAKNKAIAKDNVRWRHVGTFGEKCYLFGFGDLGDPSLDRSSLSPDGLKDTLKERIGQPSVAPSEED